MSQIAGAVGALITCDPAMKQFILWMEYKERGGDKDTPIWLIDDLDSNHLIIRHDKVDHVKQAVAKFVEQQNTERTRKG